MLTARRLRGATRAAEKLGSRSQRLARATEPEPDSLAADLVAVARVMVAVARVMVAVARVME
eukprot:5545112-Pleurochrysis_carterae.AAC.1